MRARLIEGTEIEFEDSPFSDGAEKAAFFTKDRKSVVLFFFKTSGDPFQRRQRLDRILGDYNVTSGAKTDYWRQHFYWPTGIIDGSAHSIHSDFLSRHNLIAPGLAVVVPTYGPNFRFRDIRGKDHEKNALWFTGSMASRLVPKEEMGTLQTRVKLCAKVARAVRKMHSAGLAHSDLSNKNVLIDTRRGDACIVDIDSLVVPRFAPPTVIGTPGYIAPEVLTGKGAPCVAADCHALAVLFYEVLLNRHPLRGKLIHADDPQVDELLMMGQKALFVENPKDPSNRLRTPPQVRMEHLGPFFSKACLGTFVDGLHNPARRTSAPNWEKALYKTFDLLHPTPDGSNWFVLAPGMPTRCPYSGQKITRPVPFAYLYVEGKNSTFVHDPDGRTLTIFENFPLMKWHTHANQWPDENADPKRQGYFAFHKGKWYLQNESGSPMQVVKGPSVPSGTPIEITRGLQLMVGVAPHRRILVFDFLQPC